MRYFLPHPSAEASEFNDNLKFTSVLQQSSCTREKIAAGIQCVVLVKKSHVKLLTTYEKA